MTRKLLILLLLAAAPALQAAEGMWTLDNLPKAKIQQQYGYTPDQAFADRAMHASVRLAGGCSGSFVSPDGLVMTNHHCANECIQQLSTAQKDYIESGFLARERKDEVMCPQIELNRLEQISDVTARVTAATKGKRGKDYSTAQKAEKSIIESACVGKDKDTSRCDVVELYHGGQYALYRYHRYQDVRLAFAPEKGIAFFGGDPDNFNFPRYDLDLSLLRAYENGKPAVVQAYFPFSKSGAEVGELTFVTGHPGSTQRQLTVAQLELLRDVSIPTNLLRLAEARGMLNQYAAAGGEAARVSQEDRFGIENSYKAFYGEFQALLDPVVFKRKQADEAALKSYLKQHPAATQDSSSAWDEIAAAQGIHRSIESRYQQIERGRAFWSEQFHIARVLLRGADERSKPNPSRLREYTDAGLPTLTQNLFSTAPISKDYEKLKLGYSLTKMREILGADDAFVKAVLGKESPVALANRLIDGSQLSDVAVRKQLWDGGAAAVAASNDPFIVLARQVDAEARSLRKRMEDEVQAVENQNAERIAKVRFAKDGKTAYPDATFTLRLSYGEVKGWIAKGAAVAPYTSFGGAFERNTGADPFALPASWLRAKDKLNLSQRFDFVTSNDIIGGNSGSPVTNRNGEVVGLVFDGNIESLGGAFYYDETVNRAVAVHSGAILEALDKIYGAKALVQELTGP